MTKEKWAKVKAWSPIIISALALVVAVGGNLATWLGVFAALNRDTKQQEELAKNEKDRLERSWQATVMYQIIEEGTRDNDRGMTLTEIKDKYDIRAQAAEGIDLPKRKLQELEVRRILLELIEFRDIYQTIEDRFITSRSTTAAEGRVQGFIICRATNYPGQFDRVELRRLATKDGYSTDDLFDVVFNSLISQKQLFSDAKGKLYAATPCTAFQIVEETKPPPVGIPPEEIKKPPPIKKPEEKEPPPMNPPC